MFRLTRNQPINGSFFKYKGNCTFSTYVTMEKSSYSYTVRSIQKNQTDRQSVNVFPVINFLIVIDFFMSLIDKRYDLFQCIQVDRQFILPLPLQKNFLECHNFFSFYIWNTSTHRSTIHIKC